MKTKEVIKKLIPQKYHEGIMKLKNDIFDGYALKSYSQEGEDMILRKIFEEQRTGFYVDIGAHHPKRFSNTYYFYKQGWSGINVDATPGSMTLFKKIRHRDINIEAAVAKEIKELTFFMFNEPALNTCDKKTALSRENEKYHIVDEIIIETKTLSEILKENLPEGQRINFLSVDAEGTDLEVLQSNDWQIYRPEYVLVECKDLKMNEIKDNEVYKFLLDKKYEFMAKTFNTVIFKTTTNRDE